jgi:hypothetical protein
MMMSPTIQRLMRVVGESRPYRLTFLLSASFLWKPSDFLPTQGRAVPRFFRTRWVRALPIAPAAVFGATMGSVLNWMGMLK